LPLTGRRVVETSAALAPWFCNLSFKSSIFLYSCSLLNSKVICVACSSTTIFFWARTFAISESKLAIEVVKASISA
jgi:hypothetical protein